MADRILAIRFGSLGDVILTSPAVLNLKLAAPGNDVVFLTKERFRRVAERFDGVDRVVTIPDQSSLPELYSVLLELDAHGFDIVVDLHGNPRSWLSRKLIAADRKAVYPKRRIERLEAVRGRGHSVQSPSAWPHTIDLYNEAVAEIGLPVVCRRPQMRFSLPPREIQGFLDSSQPVVVIAPGAAHPPKQWPIEHFARVAELLHVRHGARIIWAVTDTDVHKVRIRRHVRSEDLFELVNEPVELLAAIVAHARLTIANDSGVAHLSSAVGTPVLALFGPTHPVLGFAPRGLRDQVVEVDEFCRPCSRHGARSCYRDEQYCFTRITPEVVVDRAVDVIHALKGRAGHESALFVDRDGTIIKDKDYLADPGQVELIDGAAEALRAARNAGYKIAIVSNQSGVARGYFDLEAVERANARLLELLSAESVRVDGLFFCPHLPSGSVAEFAIDCDCRKPSAGMAEEAARILGLNLRRSVAIGDKLSDLHFGRVFGGRSLLVRTGYGRATEAKLNAAGERVAAFDDLKAAVDHLVAQARTPIGS